MTTAIERKTLQYVKLQDKNIMIVALIIGKTEPKYFISKRNEEFCGVITFTVRDSKLHYTNLKIWSDKEKVTEIDSKFHLYDVIDIVKPKIIYSSSSSGNGGIQYEPTISTTFTFIITEDCGYIEHHGLLQNGQFANMVKELINEPLKPLKNILNLADINSSGLQFTGQFVDLLIGVRTIKPVRNLKSKTGTMLQCLELVVIDKSFLNGISFTIWNREWIKRIIENWEPLKMILYLIDIRIGFSTFYKNSVLGMSSSSLIIENPHFPEADQLRNFIMNTTLPESDILNFNSMELPTSDSIKTVMTVQQIYDRLNNEYDGTTSNSSEQFTGIIYGIITKIDLDGFSSLIAKKCKICKTRLKRTELNCSDEKCQMQFSFNHSGDKFDRYFDINIHITDHTGTLQEARLNNNNIAEEIFNANMEDFLKMTSNELKKLKWKFLMNRIEAKLFVKKKSQTRKNNYITIIDLKIMSLNEMADKILVY